MLDSIMPSGKVVTVMRTLTAEATHEASSLVAAASVLRPEESCYRPFGTVGNLDREIQKPGQGW